MPADDCPYSTIFMLGGVTIHDDYSLLTIHHSLLTELSPLSYPRFNASMFFGSRFLCRSGMWASSAVSTSFKVNSGKTDNSAPIATMFNNLRSPISSAISLHGHKDHFDVAALRSAVYHGFIHHQRPARLKLIFVLVE